MQRRRPLCHCSSAWWQKNAPQFAFYCLNIKTQQQTLSSPLASYSRMTDFLIFINGAGLEMKNSQPRNALL
jgi:hypothetical protein